MRVLVAEDDPALRSVLERALRENGYVVDTVGKGDDALAYFRLYEYEVAVVDWRMPGLSGVDVVAGIRRRGIHTPVLMLTARDTASDRIAGLNLGADDYMVKPFDLGELLARLRALQRRPAVSIGRRLLCRNLVLDPDRHQVTVNDEAIVLTVTEMRLLEVLLRRQPSVVTRRSLALQVWDDEADAIGSNTIDVHIARIRAKISGSDARIETVRGSGYRMVAG